MGLITQNNLKVILIYLKNHVNTWNDKFKDKQDILYMYGATNVDVDVIYVKPPINYKFPKFCNYETCYQWRLIAKRMNIYKDLVDYIAKFCVVDIGLRNVESLIILNQTGVEQYFENIFGENFNIDGFTLKLHQDYNCDYCGGIINKRRYYYCWDCRKDICSFCFNEASNVCNGGDKTNKHDVQERIVPFIPTFHNFTCDFCRKIFDYYEKGWTDRQSYYDFDSKDICLICAETDEGKHYINENKLQYTEVNQSQLEQIWSILRIGSLLDWIPLYVDISFNRILYNYNKDSKYYKQIAIMSYVDRCNIFTIKDSLDTLLDKLETYNYSDDSETTPLEHYLNKLGVQVL